MDNAAGFVSSISLGRFGQMLGLRQIHPESGELLYLDAMRFLAAIAIVLCHSVEFFFPEIIRERVRLGLTGFHRFVASFASGLCCCDSRRNCRYVEVRKQGAVIRRTVGAIDLFDQHGRRTGDIRAALAVWGTDTPFGGRVICRYG